MKSKGGNVRVKKSLLSVNQKVCLKCGKTLNLKRKYTTGYCRRCYISLNALPKKYCLKCGKEITKNSTYCRECYSVLRKERKSKCIDCGKELRQKMTTRCKKCYLKYLSNIGMDSRMSKARATALRNNPSKAEIKTMELLDYLKISYQCQVPYGRYILDFLCKDLNLVIEVHGEYWHDRQKTIERDMKKKKILESNGYNVLELKTQYMHFWVLKIMEFMK